MNRSLPKATISLFFGSNNRPMHSFGLFIMRSLLFPLKLAIIASCLFLAISGQEAPANDPVIAEAYLAKSGIDGKAGDAETIFRPNDIPIFCVVRLTNAEPKKVKMELIAVNVAGVKPETSVISTAYTLGENEDRVNFTGKPHGKWVAGKYRADIYVGDKLETSLDFEVRQPVAKPVPVNNFVRKTTKSNTRKP